MASGSSTFDFQYEPGFIPQHRTIQPPTPTWVPNSLAVPLDQIATHFFFSNFVTVPNSANKNLEAFWTTRFTL